MGSRTILKPTSPPKTPEEHSYHRITPRRSHRTKPERIKQCNIIFIDADDWGWGDLSWLDTKWLDPKSGQLQALKTDFCLQEICSSPSSFPTIQESMINYLTSIFCLALLAPLSLAQEAAPKPKKKTSYLETGGERKLDIVYKKIGKRELKLDLYLPTEKQSQKAPTLIYTHGGGWAAGSRGGATKGSFSSLFKHLLKEGFAVASVDYRLARAKSGVAMRDCVIDSKDAVRYLAKHSESLGLNREQFYAFGDSAGGQIAQMLLLAPSSSLAGDAKLAEIPCQIVAGVSWYGPCDFEDMNLFNHDDSPGFRDRFGPRILGGKVVSPEEKLRLYREMSPVTYLKKDSPPLFMIQGNKDTTIPVKHAYRMEKRAKEIQAPVKILVVKNSGHNWRKVDAPIEPSRDEIITATAEYFLSHAKASK